MPRGATGTFDAVYDDFSGGYFVGNRETQQPMNTWVGTNVVATADQGFLMPDNGWLTSNVAFEASSPSIPTAWPVVVASSFPAINAFNVALVSASKAYIVDQGGSASSTALGFSPSNVIRCATVGGALMIPNNGAANIAVGTPPAAFTTYATPATFQQVWYWGGFWWGTDGGSKIYYSAPNDYTSWPGANYYTIGDTTAVEKIVSTIPSGSSLLVLTSTSWYALTGVAGATLTVRRIGSIGGITDNAPGGASPTLPSWESPCFAAETVYGTMFPSTSPDPAKILRGSAVAPAITLPGINQYEGILAQACTNVGAHVVVSTRGASTSSDPNDDLWIFSQTTRRWRRSRPPTSAVTGGGTRYMVARDDYDGTSRIVAVQHRQVGGVFKLFLYGHPKEPTQPFGAGGFDTATVTLPDTVKSTPFTVKDVLIEVDFGNVAADMGERSISCQVNVDPILDLEPSTTAKVSTTQTKTFRLPTSTAGQRAMVRFTPDIGGVRTFNAAPVLTLKGLKVRRVIMHCEFEGAWY